MSEIENWWQSSLGGSVVGDWRARDAALLGDSSVLTLRESVALRAAGRPGVSAAAREKAWDLRKAALRKHVDEQIRDVEEANALFSVTVAAIELVREPGALMDALLAGALHFASDGGLQGAAEADQVKAKALET